MKKTRIIFSILVIALCLSLNLSAQVTVSNNANTEILAPIMLEANLPLEFGKIAILSGSGTVEMSASDSPVLMVNGDVSLVSGTIRTAAKYTVSGAPNYKYSISVPTSPVTITKVGGGASVTISNFKCLSVGTPNTAGGTLTSGGTDNFYVGATLNIGSLQPPGNYTGSFNVSVNYD